MKALKLTSIVFLLLALSVMSLNFYSKPKQQGNKEAIILLTNNDYSSLWKKTDSLANKGLYKDANTVTGIIYMKAKAENNSVNAVKAVIYKIKFESYLEEENYVKAITYLDVEAQSAVFPVKPILHSVLAEVYWKYYQQNRSRFLKRSVTANFVQTDIRTWDLKKIVDEVIKNYMLSLENADSSKHTPITKFNDILITKNDSKKFRPTLYDFLSHRAVDFFMQEEPGILTPANKFELDNEKYFSKPEDFIGLKINTSDKFSLKYYAMIILQDLLKFHLYDQSPDALIDADLKRLKFVKNNSILASNDSLYLIILRQLEKKYKSYPANAEVKFEIANYYYTQGQGYKPESQEEKNNNELSLSKWANKKALSICDSTIKLYPDAYGSDLCLNLKETIISKSLSFKTEKVNIPDKPFKILLEYKNLKQVFIKIAKADPLWVSRLERRYNYDDMVKKFTLLSSIKSFPVKLEDDGDYQNHSVELAMPELQKGYYVILVGTDPSFTFSKNAVAYSTCWISNISYMERKKVDGSVNYILLNRDNGLPIANASAQQYVEKYNYTLRDYEYNRGKTYTSNSNGEITIPAPSDYLNFFTEFKSGNDRVFSDYTYQYRNYSNQNEKQKKCYYFTDRSIYRPGQTIFFKGIMIETKGDSSYILPNFNSTTTFYDVNSQKINEVNLTTNEYGTFNGSFTAPSGVLNGNMYIGNSYGWQYISVEEYKRPKFEVKFKPVKGSYKVNEMVAVSGEAKSFAGSNIDNAEVKYRVVRTVSYPYWWGWWYPYYQNSAAMEIANGLVNTDESGVFKIDFKAIPDYKTPKVGGPVFNYAVYADVTDINGETHSSAASVYVAYNAITVDVEIPEQIEKSSKEKYQINSRNINGEYEHSSGTISIYKVEQPATPYKTRLWTKPDLFILSKLEHDKAFPNDAYNDEDNYMQWKKQIKVLEINYNTQKDSLLSLQNMDNWSVGKYLAEVKSKDKFNDSVKSFKYFTVFSSKGKEIPLSTYDWFTTLKSSGEPGENAEFLVGSQAKINLRYEVESKGKIVSSQWIVVNNEQRKIEIPIKESYRGNFTVHFLSVVDNRCYTHDVTVIVPYTNKELDFEFETFRNKLLPGEKEEWKIKIKGINGDKIAAEMLASMYDASLDAFKPQSWNFGILNYFYSTLQWNAYNSFTIKHSNVYFLDWNSTTYFPRRAYDALNWFGFNYYGYDRYYGWMEDGGDEQTKSFRGDRTESTVSDLEESLDAPAPPVDDKVTTAMGKSAGGLVSQSRIQSKEEDNKVANPYGAATGSEMIPVRKAGQLSGILSRKNFNETAFFYPELKTDENGNVVISFTMPEALTKWKFSGLAHTKDLKLGQFTKEIITQKDLMIMPNPPRFFREGDKITFAAKISNLASDDLAGDAMLSLFDASTMTPIDVELKNDKNIVSFSAKKGQSCVVSWNLEIPVGIDAITYKIVAKSGNFTDGEEMTIPVLTNRMLVTESLPLPIRGKQTKEYTFEKLVNSASSTTLKNHKVTFEFSYNPAWYAIQALPYMMEYPYECAEQTFSRFYANSIAKHIANSSPRIKAVFDSWKNVTPDALLSNLEKNQELKNIVLQETPWVLNAKDESQRKRNVALLFDLNRMANELVKALKKLEKMQVANGGWPWFPGMEDDRYITQHIVTGMGHLDKLGIKDIKEDNKVWKMIKNAAYYLDDRITEDYLWIVKYYPKGMNLNHLSSIQIQYLYARSFFIDKLPVEVKNKIAFNYFKGQAQKYWLENNRYMQGMTALALFRMGDKIIPLDIMKSLSNNAIHSDEFGMYWKDMDDGYYWYQAPIETQALLIEAYSEITNDTKTVEELKVWLLKQKQTQDWKTTKATAEACYALLLKGTDWLAAEPKVEITLGDKVLDPTKIPYLKQEAGTGYFKTSWTGADLKPELGKIKIVKSDDGVSWGAMYWQYFEQLDKITTAKTPLQLEKKLFVQKNTPSGPVIEPISENNVLKVGDKIKVRIEIRVDRDMEYVHLKDMRAAAFEPINVLSQYKYQDGLGYYESTGDVATNFFISHLKKGTYVFEYPLRVAQKGDFSNGITSIQCMYAPEFSSHSEGIRVKVE